MGAAGGAGPIPFTAIDAYARRYGIGEGDIDEFDRFRSLIKAMDSAYLAARASKPSSDDQFVDEVDITDPEAVKRLTRRLAKAPTPKPAEAPQAPTEQADQHGH